MCEHCGAVILSTHERVGLLRNGALLVFHARCFGAWSARSRADEVDRLVAAHAADVVAAAEQIAHPPAA